MWYTIIYYNTHLLDESDTFILQIRIGWQIFITVHSANFSKECDAYPNSANISELILGTRFLYYKKTSVKDAHGAGGDSVVYQKRTLSIEVCGLDATRTRIWN